MSEAGDPSSPPADKYNPIFETFVGKEAADERDLPNLIAYSLYKKAKVEWISKFKSEKKRAPTQEELIAYYETWTQTQIDALRDRAKASLAAFGESVIEDAKPDILREALRGKFANDIARAMLASLLYTIFLIIMVLVLRWSGVDFLELLEKAKPVAQH